jgi:hypothetical protein
MFRPRKLSSIDKNIIFYVRIKVQIPNTPLIHLNSKIIVNEPKKPLNVSYGH